MSDALNYLIKMRPEAMGAYFQFLKEAGTHLDPRTRDLISVITKVHVQTEAGFKQYLMRALRNGASPHEVIDALLMAFPALGLAKIIWATDILLSMDIPEFRPDMIDAQAVWHDLAALEEIPVGETVRLDADSRHVFVHRDADSIHVYDSRCPHQVTDIPHLALEGNQLTCPKHGWVFDIRSGECIQNGKEPLKRFEHKIENGRLLAYW
jgi:nitrite reductase/ring-hydroxylating ferredoxin subunit/alkylhydroperoxidase/carboxymuconolactone decarboxylase family protein YurZ